jgi:hypothetical protein
MSNKKVKVLDWLPAEIKISSTEKDGIVKCVITADHGYPAFDIKPGKSGIGFVAKETDSLNDVMKQIFNCLHALGRHMVIKTANVYGYSGREEEFLKENGIELDIGSIELKKPATYEVG